MSLERAIFEQARRRLGAPYLWAAKGDWAVRSGAVVPCATLGAEWATDCSGLITTSIHAAGGPDLRGMWGSERMRTDLPEPQSDETLLLLCYPGHVALGLGGTSYTLEAAGGDATTLTVPDALKRGACVMFGPATHGPRPTAVRSLRALVAQK